MSSPYGPPPVSSPTGPPPPPPPKPYSQDVSRINTPAAPPPHPIRYSQQFEQPPLPPHPSYQQSPPPLPPQQHYQQQPYPHQDAQSSYNVQQVQPQQAQGPPLPTSFELPEHIVKQSTSDLSKLLSDPALIHSLAQLHPAYTTALQPLQNQINSNVSLASQVSSLEKQVKELRESTGQLMLQHTSLQTQWRRKQSEMDEALAPWGPRAMYQRLVASINEGEAILTAVQESFLEGSGGGDEFYGSGGKASEKEVTDWIKRIRENATALEKRREMRARWDEGRVGGWR